MQRTKVEWAHFSWNPMTGCAYGCPYCYARRITQHYKKNYPYGFTPHFDPEECGCVMPKKPARIFTVSMGDFWDNGFTDEERGSILYRMHSYPQHRFIILTKQSDKIVECENTGNIKFPKNLWMGVTIDHTWAKGRLHQLFHGVHGTATHPFISFEPLLGRILGEIDPEGFELFFPEVEWVIIGSQTNPHKDPPFEWVEEIIRRCMDVEIPYFVKNNMHSLFINHGMGEMFRQDYPEGLKVK